jgi:hypothetical protein
VGVIAPTGDAEGVGLTAVRVGDGEGFRTVRGSPGIEKNTTLSVGHDRSETLSAVRVDAVQMGSRWEVARRRGTITR